MNIQKIFGEAKLWSLLEIFESKGYFEGDGQSWDPDLEKIAKQLIKKTGLEIPTLVKIIRYYRNAENRLRGRLTTPIQYSHEGINLCAYIDYLEIRALSISPRIDEILKEEKYDVGIELGSGPGTNIFLLKQAGIINRASILDTDDVIHALDTNYTTRVDFVFNGNLTLLSSWESLKKIFNSKERNMLLLSDVLHGKTLQQRKFLFSCIQSNPFLGDYYIREFSGFSSLDAFMFDIQLDLFAKGQTLSFNQIKKEIGLFNLSLESLWKGKFYWIAKIVPLRR